jgi:hypothetical protein
MAKIKGEDVMVVTARGEHVPAKIIKRNEDGTIDVEFVYADKETVLITSSPRDDKREKPDSWHFPSAVEIAADPAQQS